MQLSTSWQIDNADRPYSMDALWRPYSRVCQVCQLNFDHILRAEELDAEMAAFLFASYGVRATESG